MHAFNSYTSILSSGALENAQMIASRLPVSPHHENHAHLIRIINIAPESTNLRRMMGTVLHFNVNGRVSVAVLLMSI